MSAIRIVEFGERAIAIRDLEQGRVRALTSALLPALSDGRLVDLVPGDGSLLVIFDGSTRGEATARTLVEAAVSEPPVPPTPRRHVVPVRYGASDGPDLTAAAALAGLTPDALVALHTGRDHEVLFLGFAPGFAYIGGLAPELVLPRLATPRVSTPPGSVAIAESYTGIYPVGLPGGWRIIGRTDLRLFDPTADPPTTFEPGDIVRFEAVS